ncbi:MAG TPA: 3-isopropylmalate dehydratase small subunit [Polyangia bacterium]|jgi:3-isopropylmalate/(R)-2-methylmalate dehydratase small subunit
MNSKLERVRGRLVTLAANDVDTDQIIPARFLKTTSRAGLGTHLFADWRYAEDGSPRPEFALNRPDAAGAVVLVAGANFGCGSSREHAPWALVEWGLRAVIARSFADIFRQNALKNGLIPVEVPEDVHQFLKETRALDPSIEVTVDVRAARLMLPDGEAVPFAIDPFAQRCLVEGIDELGYLRGFEARIRAFEEEHG